MSHKLLVIGLVLFCSFQLHGMETERPSLPPAIRADIARKKTGVELKILAEKGNLSAQDKRFVVGLLAALAAYPKGATEVNIRLLRELHTKCLVQATRLRPATPAEQL